MRSALAAIEHYNLEHHGYQGMTTASLRAHYAPDLPSDLSFGSASPASYCIQATRGSLAISKNGWLGAITPGQCIPMGG